ncbi:hypothetical protein V1514DRAFT_334852 [Lipomyces japonicus]|uniref:uncharacterized protein n=1 Tax=Lipomyces japonicus TaxID=56871 RepID=UPI0034CEAE59
MAYSAFELQSNQIPRPSIAALNRNDVYAALLPRDEVQVASIISPREITVVTLKLKSLIDELIPIEVKETRITRPGGSVITPDVIELAVQAAPGEKKACLIFALLICKHWYHKLELAALFDADLYALRALACEILAKRIIENELDTDQEFLFKQILCRRFTYLQNGKQVTDPRSVLELAVDLHALTVIGSSGYQKCMTWMWHGWIIQSPYNPLEYISYDNVAVPSFWTHFDPDRIKTPLYQNALQLLFSVIYLALYTGAVNTANPGGSFDPVEGLLYIFTLGFMFEEISKFYHVGRYYFSFWSVFNVTLYSMLIVSFIIRLVALASPYDSSKRHGYDTLSYRILAFSAPMVWSRLLLYLDMQKFFGVMLVVLKELMKESVVFFVLLIIIVIGFLQAFVGLDSADGAYDVGSINVAFMTRSILGSPEFEPYEDFAAPFGALLNYVFTFVVSVLLLNILIALFNSAYEKIYDNANDEYMALFSQKTLRFVRAPDENLFIPPLNLIEIFGLIIPLEWWMKKEYYAKLNDYVMLAVYSPILLLTASYEVYVAKRILRNRAEGEEDDETRQEWEEIEDQIDFETDGWMNQIRAIVPHVGHEPGLWELTEFRKHLCQISNQIQHLQSEINKIEISKTSGVSSSGETDGTLLDEGSSASSHDAKNK